MGVAGYGGMVHGHAACGMGDGQHTGMVGIGFACVGVDLRVLFCTPRKVRR